MHMVLSLYGCGVCLVLLFRLAGSIQLWLLHRKSFRDLDGQQLIDQWRTASGIIRPIQILTSSSVSVPMTWGILNPSIVLPQNYYQRSLEDFYSAMRHEFSHVRNHDAAKRWLATLVIAIWWPHPMVWAANRAWKLDQERACDDEVLKNGAQAVCYAEQLLNTACSMEVSGFQNAAALVMASPKGLEKRLQALISNTIDRSSASRETTWKISFSSILAVLIALAFQSQLVASTMDKGRLVIETKFIEWKGKHYPLGKITKNGKPDTADMETLIKKLTTSSDSEVIGSTNVTVHSKQKTTFSLTENMNEEGNDDPSRITSNQKLVLASEITPTLLNDSKISLKISAKRSQFFDTSKDPIILNQSTSTNCMVNSGNWTAFNLTSTNKTPAPNSTWLLVRISLPSSQKPLLAH